MINLKLFSCVLTRLHKRKLGEFSKARRSVWKKNSCFSTNILCFNMESKYLYTTYSWKYATVNTYLYCIRTLQINKWIEILMYLGKHKLSVISPPCMCFYFYSSNKSWQTHYATFDWKRMNLSVIFRAMLMVRIKGGFRH